MEGPAGDAAARNPEGDWRISLALRCRRRAPSASASSAQLSLPTARGGRAAAAEYFAEVEQRRQDVAADGAELGRSKWAAEAATGSRR